ncbi:hypothetical protein HMN09_00854200 [Mycena chlorophos]|uniref:Uncharacterized protein n=2 Tax=Mycena chlorophos TaxID=658473 RepID=A0A146H8E3_MYCCL|nr:hypothetical protein HMN09_00854200 [Mycena chlorophos]GAT44992.1 predicted protein [Mycena chlorophos]
MTRCASPNGAVEFCYDFPVASTSTATHHQRTNTHSQRARSPRRRYAPSPVRRSFDVDDDGTTEDEMELDDEDTQYAVYHTGRAATHPIPRPTPTGNQWTRPSSPSHLSPFYPTSTSTFTPASYESERSVLSSFSHDNNKRHCAINKIRKPRRSVDEPAPPSASSLVPPAMAYSSSSGSSAPSSPYSIASDDFSDDDDALFGSPEMELSELPSVEEEEQQHSPHQHHETGMAIKKQWTALSMRVRFGVFRAKRRMRDRVLSL